MNITKVGIVGGGQMGGGIAEVCIKADIDTVIVEISDDLVEHSLAGINRSLAKAVDRGKLTDEARTEALERLRFTTDLGLLSHRDPDLLL